MYEKCDEKNVLPASTVANSWNGLKTMNYVIKIINFDQIRLKYKLYLSGLKSNSFCMEIFVDYFSLKVGSNSIFF